jgi:hypothetical protein
MPHCFNNLWDIISNVLSGSSLTAMKSHAIENSVTRIAMPKVGCGLDRLDWSRVFPMIREIFADSKIEVDIYYLE